MKSAIFLFAFLPFCHIYAQISPQPRHLEEIAFDAKRNELLVFGGGEQNIGEGTTYPNELFVWNGIKWAYKTGNGPKNRYAHALVYNAYDNATYLIGGVEHVSRTVARNVWKWDGSNWQQVLNECPVKSIEAAFDANSNRILVYGNAHKPGELTNNGDPLQMELWELKKATWRRLSADGPQIASQFEVAFDNIRNTLVIPTWEKGGSVVWEWVNEKWIKVSAMDDPIPERNRFALTYNPIEKATFLYGGRNNTDLFLSDLWRWDGVHWTKLNLQPQPPGRAAATMEYGNGSQYLYGGVASWGLSNEIWQLTHSKWKLANPNEAMTESRTVKALEKWLNDHPDDGNVLMRYGTLLGSQKKYPDAENLLKRALTGNNNDHNILLNLCTLLYEQGKNTEAKTLIEEAVKTDKYNRNGYVRLANYFLSNKKYETSIACFTKAISIEPQIGEYYNLACAYALNLNIDKAFDALQLAVDMGFNSKSQIESDPDLSPLKNDGRWSRLLEKMK